MINKKSILLISGTAVFYFSQWLMLILVANILDFRYAGMLSLAITLTAVFFVFSHYGLRLFQVSDIDAEYTDRQYYLSRLITTTAGFLLCVLYCVCFQNYTAEERIIIILFMVYKCLESFSDLGYGYYQNSDRFDYIFFSLALKGTIQLAVFIAGLYLFSDFYYTIIFLSLSILAIIIFYDLPRIRRNTAQLHGFTKEDFAKVMQLLKKCFPMLIVLLTTILLQAIPRLSFESQYSEELFGKFSSVASPTIIISLFISNALTPLLPRFAKLYKDNDYKGFTRIYAISIVTTLVIGAASLAAAYLLGEEVLVILYNEDIRPYAYILGGIIVTVIFSCVVSCYHTLFMAIRRLAPLAIVQVLCCGLCYIIAPYLVSNYEMTGIVYASVVAYGVAITVFFVMAVSAIYNMKKLKQ